jgi:hypothetical protein
MLAQLLAATEARETTPTNQQVGTPEKFRPGTPQAAGFDFDEIDRSLRGKTEAATGSPTFVGQHTPGPWETEQEVMNEHHNLTEIFVRHVDSGRICQTFANCLVNTDEACRANARLIAAAPELMAACQGLLHIAETGVMSLGTLRLAHAALAKATGSAS